MNVIDEIEKLRQLTKQVPNHNPGVKLGRMLILDTITGKAVSESLLHIPAIAVANTIFEGGCHVDVHNHDQTEILVVYQGEMILRTEEWVKAVTVGECVRIEPHIKHTAEFPVKTRIIAITVPASKYFPKNDD